MSEEEKNTTEKLSVQPSCFGRTRYFTSYKATDITKENVVEIVRSYFTKFSLEIFTLRFLDDYFRGKQPILEKKRDDENSENYQVVINLARTATNNIKHAFIGEETQYLPISTDNELQKKALKDLLNMYRVIEEPAHNSRIESDRGKFGYAYEYVGKKNDVIQIKRLKPYHTCAVYSEDDEDEMVFVFNFYHKYNTNGEANGYHFNIYTNKSAFIYDTSEIGAIDGVVTEVPNDIGMIPVVVYENNDELMGDFEPAIPVLNGINAVYSKRLDNISDIVEALLVFLNTTIYDETTDENGKTSYDDTRLKTMRKNRAVEIHGEPGLPADIKHIVNTLDQSNTQIVCDNLARLAYTIMNVPDGVNAKTSGGGDTGEAANTREGYKSFEQLLNDKERLFKKALKRRIELIKRLSLFDNNTQLRFIKTNEIDIRFIREKTLNSQSEAQMIATLSGTGLFSPDTVITQSNLCESPQEEIDKVMANYKKLKDDGVITEEQYQRAVLAYYIPSDKINYILTANANIDKGETNGTDKKEREPIQPKED